MSDSILDEDLPPDQLISDISNRLTRVSILQSIASTVCFDIINALAAYCLVLRELRLKGFWSATNDDLLLGASVRSLDISDCLSGTATFDSAPAAVESVFYKALPNEELHRLVKFDLCNLLKNRDWRKGKEKRDSFVFLAFSDLLTLLIKARKLSDDSDQKKTLFRACKKLEFYLKWLEMHAGEGMKRGEDISGVMKL